MRASPLFSQMRRFLYFAILLGAAWNGSGFDPSSQDDSVALARHFKPRPNPVGPPIQQSSFEPLDGETIALMGGADVSQMQDHGYLETALQLAYSEKHLRIRNIGWPADTVYRQQRPMFFYTEKGDTRDGSIPDQREKIDPGLFILMFGRSESLDGLKALPEFEAAYQGLIDALKQFSERLVLIAPPPFVEVGPAAKLAVERQKVLTEYAARIEELAKRNGAVYIGLGGLGPEDFSPSGLALSDNGFRKVAIQFGKELGFEAKFDEETRNAVLAKNRIWRQYYRPTNWAFLFGDRQWVPSSRDHKDSEHRWFVDEMGLLPSMIEMAEEKIWKAAK